jgi:tRNA dimethylallyltransferase
MGPTAAGKTDLALKLAQDYPVEIISVDSALVYRGMDIGTAKPEPAVLARYPHHLVNIIEPTESYSVGDFRRDALTLMADITRRNKVPLLVGGTMLYFKALQQGLADLPEADTQVRAKLDLLATEKGLSYLHERLIEVDPVSAKRIHPNDPQRIQRALEVYEITGKSMTELTNTTSDIIPYRVIKLILSPFDRAVLHQRIAARYEIMMESGFVEEVNKLFVNSECHAELPAIRSVGYRQVWQYLAGEVDLSTCIDKAIIATRQMAKRQLTWLRAQPDGTWFDTGDGLPMEQIESFLSDSLPELNINTES